MTIRNAGMFMARGMPSKEIVVMGDDDTAFSVREL